MLTLNHANFFCFIGFIWGLVIKHWERYGLLTVNQFEPLGGDLSLRLRNSLAVHEP